ncbi:MAG: response regulator [Chitinophagaceae bacterium]|nr:response regulator [Chitinophagaceae bacterium]
MLSKKILMAEDDEEDVDIFKQVLTDLTVHVNLEVAANGIELMVMLEDATVLPELIFLDLNMPFKNGMVCLQEIKANHQWKNIKVVILSTSSHQDQMKTAYEKGADFYMIKSTSYTDFKNAVAACLEKQAVNRT